jgi:hypothetical protein
MTADFKFYSTAKIIINQGTCLIVMTTALTSCSQIWMKICHLKLVTRFATKSAMQDL